MNSPPWILTAKSQAGLVHTQALKRISPPRGLKSDRGNSSPRPHRRHSANGPCAASCPPIPPPQVRSVMAARVCLPDEYRAGCPGNAPTVLADGLLAEPDGAPPTTLGSLGRRRWSSAY